MDDGARRSLDVGCRFVDAAAREAHDFLAHFGRGIRKQLAVELLDAGGAFGAFGKRFLSRRQGVVQVHY
jgi:hypothetical protein